MHDTTNTPKPAAYVGQKAVERWRAENKEAVTSGEIATALRVTDQTVRGFPGLSYTVVGGRGDRRYLVDEVERWLIAQTRAPKASPDPEQVST
jgi:NADH/NAD ratio-sensing transcriptional regulator Rex